MKVDVPVIRCPTCDVPYVLRYSLHLAGGPPDYLYQRDCKHKSLAAGPVPDETAELVVP